MSESVIDYWPTRATRVTAGVGALGRVGDAIDELGGTRALLVTSPSLLAERQVLSQLTTALGARLSTIWSGARPHVPWATVQDAAALAREHHADTIVSLGGGSSIDTGKAIVWLARDGDPALHLRHIAIPSTLGGADLTPFAGVTRDGGGKVTLSAPPVAPEVSIHDPRVAATAPGALLRPSIANAVAHCLEGLVSVGATPVSDACFSHSLRLIARAVRGLDGGETVDLQTLATLQAGAALASAHPVPMGLAHALVHAVAARLDVAHGIAHGVIGPAVMAFNAPVVADRQLLIAAALGADDAVLGARTLMDALGVPAGLAAVGVDRAMLDDVARTAIASPSQHNPRAVTSVDELCGLLDDIWGGIGAGTTASDDVTLDDFTEVAYDPDQPIGRTAE